MIQTAESSQSQLLPPKHVGVVHEHDVLRRGIAEWLDEDQFLTVVFAISEGPAPEPVDVAVVSVRALTTTPFDCNVVVFGEDMFRIRADQRAHVCAALSLGMGTAEQLIASVRAAAAGLRVEAANQRPSVPNGLDERRLEVLRLLADGDSTRVISSKLCYSERTIKSLIQNVESELHANNRAHAVAAAIRNGLI
jgi:DNA-binding CsgD family transcriptional regulator